MDLRLPAVIAVVAVAGSVAAVRAFHPPSPAAAFAASDPEPPVRRVALARVLPSSSPELVVYVAGAVAKGGVYRLAASARADDAVRAAGGATATADLVAVNLAARLNDGDEVVVPERGAENDVVPSTDAATSTTPKHHKRKKRHKKKRKMHRHTAAVVAAETDVSGATETVETDKTTDDAAPAAPVDFNSADASELETLPGIGSELADRIVTFRELNGPFNAADDLLDVAGMTQKKLDVIEPFLVH